jgi:hypothetical protein
VSTFPSVGCPWPTSFPGYWNSCYPTTVYATSRCGVCVGPCSCAYGGGTYYDARGTSLYPGSTWGPACSTLAPAVTTLTNKIGAVCDSYGCAPTIQPAAQTCTAYGCSVQPIGPPNLLSVSDRPCLL